MFQSIVKTPDEALCHLFLHCCMKDGALKSEELDMAADRIVRLNIHRNVDIKTETRRYVEYLSSVSDQAEYINYLVRIITPVNSLALYSYCVELILSDEQIELTEDKLLSHIGNSLLLSKEEQHTVQKLIVQRRIIESDRIF